MVQVAERYSSQLKRIKENVEKAYIYFKPNVDRYNKFRKFVFDSALDSQDMALLKTLKKPQVEFNVLEAYISRLRGEFSKQEPSYIIMAGDEEPVDVQVIDVVTGHLKHIIDEANKVGTEYQIYTDALSGGFSVVKVWTEYAHDMSFNQVIKVGRVYDPVLTGFDPLARYSHKGDGNFCFELYPKLKDDFKREYPGIDVDKLSYVKAIDGFNWSYKNQKDEILLIADYFEKKKRKVKIVKLADGKSMTPDEYKKFLEDWQLSGKIEVPPAIVEERTTEREKIVRYQIIENEVLDYEETDYKFLPLIFIDGNSIIIRQPNDQSVQQMCRPYVYQALGIQRLKNFAGQTLANELENMVQHKFMAAKESIPTEEEYMQAYRDVQQADILVYNAYNELFPDKQLPPPAVIPRVNIPQEIINTFIGTDNLTQNILGSFDMDIAKMNNSQTSGVALVEAATMNNSAAMPYIVGFLQGFNRVAEMVLDLIPKYFQTPRTLPIVRPDGKRDYVRINAPQGINLKYGENALNVRVEAGVNFSVQKSKALNQVIALMQASPLFAEFMNTEGLNILLDNIEIKGIEQIKEMANQWMEQMKKMKQQQMEQMQNQPNPAMMKMQLEQAKTQQKGQEMQGKLAVDMAKLKQDQTKVIADLHMEHEKNIVQKLKADTEKFSKMVDLELRHHDMKHKHLMDHHDRLSRNKEHARE
jgi:hypothetical protein